MHVTANNVLEKAAGTGTGPLKLGGALSSYRRFADVLKIGDSCHYSIRAVDDWGRPTDAWELGRGTYTAVDTLSRTEVVDSSNGASPVDFSAGPKHVGLTVLAPSTDRLQADWREAMGIANFDVGDLMISARDPGRGWLESGKAYPREASPKLADLLASSGPAWELVFDGSSEGSDFYSLAADSTGVAIIVRATGNENIRAMRSVDAGLTWDRFDTPGIDSHAVGTDHKGGWMFIGPRSTYLNQGTGEVMTGAETRVKGRLRQLAGSPTGHWKASGLKVESTDTGQLDTSDNGRTWSASSSQPRWIETDGQGLWIANYLPTYFLIEPNIYWATSGSGAGLMPNGSIATNRKGTWAGLRIAVSNSSPPVAESQLLLSTAPQSYWSAAPISIAYERLHLLASDGDGQWLAAGEAGRSWLVKTGSGESRELVGGLPSAGVSAVAFAGANTWLASASGKIFRCAATFEGSTHFKTPVVVSPPGFKAWLRA